jgi:hypothetical protein
MTVTCEMENGLGIATRILLINSVVAVFCFVAQIASLVTTEGPTHEYWAVYLALMLLVFVASLVAQWAVRRVSLFAGMNFFAWMCFACIAGMVIIDTAFMDSSFPVILFVLTLGVVGLGLTVGYIGAIPYAAVCAAGTLYAGLAHGDMDRVMVAVVLFAAVAAMTSESTNERVKTARRLGKLEDAVGAYIDVKRGRDPHNTAAYRGS